MIMMVMRVANVMAMMIAHWGGAMRGRNCSTSYYFYHLHQCVHQTSVRVSPLKTSHIEIIIIIIITNIIFSKVLMAKFDDHFSSSLPSYQWPSGALDHTLSPTHRRTYLHHISLLLGWVTDYSLEKNTPEEVNSCCWDLTDVADEDSYSTTPDIYHLWGTTALFRPVKR